RGQDIRKGEVGGRQVLEKERRAHGLEDVVEGQGEEDVEKHQRGDETFAGLYRYELQEPPAHLLSLQPDDRQSFAALSQIDVHEVFVDMGDGDDEVASVPACSIAAPRTSLLATARMAPSGFLATLESSS